MTGLCKINGLDAWSTWGVVIPDATASQLMSFAPLKQYITNTGALIDGKQVLSTGVYIPKVDERDMTLVFYMHASTTSQFITRRDSLESVFRQGTFTLWIKEMPTSLYRLLYISCSQFTQFNGKLAKFTLKVNEPNPNNRALE